MQLQNILISLDKGFGGVETCRQFIKVFLLFLWFFIFQQLMKYVRICYINIQKLKEVPHEKLIFCMLFGFVEEMTFCLETAKKRDIYFF